MAKRRKRGPSTDHGRSDLTQFAAEVRAARAVLGWSQTQLAKKASVTQRAISQLEKGATKARALTQDRIDKAFRDAGLRLENLPDGGFSIVVPGKALIKSRHRTAVRR
jgi:transcriptional regulator with XRE-family HTH domain